MSIIVKEKIDLHAVIVDTNILFDKDKSRVVNPDFDQFWEDHAAEANLQLMIPEVVIGELLFQQTASALKTLSRANKSFEQLSSYTGKGYLHRVNENRVEKDIRSRLYTWADGKRFQELTTPVDEIDWRSLIENSIWRRPPFTNDPKTDQEKGFRDSLILETIVWYCESEAEKKVVFICNDKLLREATEERLMLDTTFSAFESIDDFEAYLRLEKENLEQSFIKSIIYKASKKFFQYQDRKSLVYVVGLMEIINEKYSEKFQNPHSLLSDDFEGGLYSDKNWKPMSTGLYSVAERPKFQKIEGGSTFYWVSRIRFIKDYEGSHEWEDEVYLFIHELFFEIYWKVNISVNERFTKMEFIKVELIESKFSQKRD